MRTEKAERPIRFKDPGRFWEAGAHVAEVATPSLLYADAIYNLTHSVQLPESFSQIQLNPNLPALTAAFALTAGFPFLISLGLGGVASTKRYEQLGAKPYLDTRMRDRSAASLFGSLAAVNLLTAANGIQNQNLFWTAFGAGVATLVGGYALARGLHGRGITRQLN